MKTMKLLFLVILSIAFTSCSDDDNDDFGFNKESLKQTTWEGAYIKTEGAQVIKTIDAVFQFFTTEKGQSITKEEGHDTDIWDFDYSIDEKMITISDGPLLGKYTLLEFSKNKMVLVKLGTHKGTLSLNRKY